MNYLKKHEDLLKFHWTLKKFINEYVLESDNKPILVEFSLLQYQDKEGYVEPMVDITFKEEVIKEYIYNPGGGDYDPGAWEYTAPGSCSVSVNGSGQSVTLTLSASDGGSGMGSSSRFPFEGAALMQFSNDGSTWSEVRVYSVSSSWTLAGMLTVYARFRDCDGNWSDPVSGQGSAGGGSSGFAFQGVCVQ